MRVRSLSINAMAAILTSTAAAAQTYVVTLGNMVAWNGVAHAIDTDYISLSVQGPNRQTFKQTYGPNNLHKNQTTNWALSSSPISVPANPQSVLTISWAAINKGTTSLQQIGKGLSDAAEKIGQTSSNPLVLIPSTLGGEIAGFFLTSFDAPLFGGSVSFNGAQLAAGLNSSGWSPEGPNMLHAVFDYPNIPSPCDKGHYNLEVHIKRTS